MLAKLNLSAGWGIVGIFLCRCLSFADSCRSVDGNGLSMTKIFP